MQRAFADPDEHRAFRARIEAMLRASEADAALALVRQGLEALADQRLPVVDIALATSPAQIKIAGWDALAATLARLEARGVAVTAIGIDLTGSCWDGALPEIGQEVPPYLETSYYTDLPEIAFSTATRADILAAYTDYGSPWIGCFAEIEGDIEVEGLSKLYSAVIRNAYEKHRDRDDALGDAHLLAASASAILLHIAVRSAVAAGALPRPVAVIVGSNEGYPFYDAPVVSGDEARALMPARPAPAPAQATKGILGRLFG